MYFTLVRVAAQRPHAFVVVTQGAPRLYYARRTWLGTVDFEEGSEERKAVTRLRARLGIRSDGSK